MGINGSLLEDRRLTYNLKQRQSEGGDPGSSSLYGSYRSAYGTVNAGYDYSSDNRQLSLRPLWRYCRPSSRRNPVAVAGQCLCAD